MKRLFGKKNLKLIAASAMTIFSLFAVVTGAYSWFVSNYYAGSALAKEFGQNRMNRSVQQQS